jgi:hypothetical protein
MVAPEQARGDGQVVVERFTPLRVTRVKGAAGADP